MARSTSQGGLSPTPDETSEQCEYCGRVDVCEECGECAYCQCQCDPADFDRDELGEDPEED